MSQIELFDTCARPRAGAGFGALVRTRLDAQAWVDHRPRWLPEHKTLFDALRRGVRWHAERRAMYDAFVDVPRLTATVPDDGPCPPALARAHRALERHYRRRFESIRLAWYLATGRTVSRCTAIASGAASRTPWWRSCPSGRPRRFLLKPASGGTIPPLRPRRRRPAGHGRRLPAHVASRHTEGEVGRAEDQHSVPRAARG